MKSLIRPLGLALAVSLAAAVPHAVAQTAPAAQAQKDITPEHLALARAVIDFTGAGASFNDVVPQILSDARSLILRTRPELQSDLDSVIPELNTKFENRRNDLLNDIARTYAEAFTEVELKDIAAFYQSEVGRKLTSTTPKVLEASFLKARDWGQKVSSEVMDALREEMTKRGHKI